MTTLEIPTAKNVLRGELSEAGKRHMAGVIPTTMPWPTAPQKVTFRGRDAWILPVMKDRQPCIAINRPCDLSVAEAEILICNLASSLAWVERGGVIIDGVWRGSHCSPLGAPVPALVLTKELDISYLPDPAGKRARLALALMREGRRLNQAAYAFLSFYRAVEAALPGKKRAAWVEQAIGRVTDWRATAALVTLHMSQAEVGKRLYGSWRKALAHAQEDPIIDPDDPQQLAHLRGDLPIMEALAEMAIEAELGVETKLAYRKRTRPHPGPGWRSQYP